MGVLLLAIGLANDVVGATAGAVMLVAVLRRLATRKTGDEERSFLIGVAKLAGGFMAHQCWWLVSRMAFNLGHYDVSSTMTAQSWLVTPAYALMVAGALRCAAVVSPAGRLSHWRGASLVIWCAAIAAALAIT